MCFYSQPTVFCKVGKSCLLPDWCFFPYHKSFILMAQNNTKPIVVLEEYLSLLLVLNDCAITILEGGYHVLRLLWIANWLKDVVETSHCCNQWIWECHLALSVQMNESPKHLRLRDVRRLNSASESSISSCALLSQKTSSSFTKNIDKSTQKYLWLHKKKGLWLW
jgi:hypothetical protein